MWIRCNHELYQLPKKHEKFGIFSKLRPDENVSPESCLMDYLTKHSSVKDDFTELPGIIASIVIPQRGFSWLSWRKQLPPWVNEEALQYGEISEKIRSEFDTIFQPLIYEVKQTEPYIFKIFLSMLATITEPDASMFDYLIPIIRTVSSRNLQEVMRKVINEVSKSNPDHLPLFNLVPKTNQHEIWQLLHLSMNLELSYMRVFMLAIFSTHINLMETEKVRQTFRLPIAHSKSADATLTSILKSGRNIEKADHNNKT
jgi:hypothetical protein